MSAGDLDLLTDVEAGWVRPYWLERQVDPSSPAFVPSGDDQAPGNVRQRNWTTVGNLDSARLATADPRGLVTPWRGGWSLDWWIGADDRWHVPAREVAVRQRLLDATPVVETALRIPGGDAVQRVYAMRRSSLEGGGELLVVEVENGSKLPVALALAVRPYNPEGLAPVHAVDLLDGTTLTVDGSPAVLLPKPPARAIGSTRAGGDSAQVVLSGGAAEQWPGPVECPDGLAQAAVVYPLAHGASLRVALPLEPAPPRRRQRRRRSSVGEGRESFPDAVPAAAHVAKGWVAQSRRGLRIELPDSRLVEAVDANRRFLLLLHQGAIPRSDAAPAAAGSVPGEAASTAAVLVALGHQGFHDEAAAAFVALASDQGADGAFAGAHRDPDLNGALLSALGRHWRLVRERDLLDALVPAITDGARWIEHVYRRGRPPTLWSVAGLQAAAELLAAAGQPDPARGAAAVADELRERALSTGGQSPPGDVGGDGLSPALTLQLATAELLLDDRSGLDRLRAVLDLATPTWTWPETVDPPTAGGISGDGHDVLAAVALLSFVRTMLVREDGDGLVLASVVPDGWLGQGWEVHDAPTEHGRLSYAIRWHGPRPALLWELDTEDRDRSEPVGLSAPGLDPGWSTTEPSGEALLGPVDRHDLQRQGGDPPGA